MECAKPHGHGDGKVLMSLPDVLHTVLYCNATVYCHVVAERNSARILTIVVLQLCSSFTFAHIFVFVCFYSSSSFAAARGTHRYVE
jgi:hypothetical protein